MWLHLPMSVSLPASEGSTLPSSSLFQRLAASVMWRSSFRPWQSWQRVWKTVPWMMRLSGLTSEPSPANSIVAAWLEQFSASPHESLCRGKAGGNGRRNPKRTLLRRHAIRSRDWISVQGFVRLQSGHQPAA